MATSDLLVANNAYSTLASSISDSDTTITVAGGEGARFPAASSGSGTYFYATLIDTSNNLEIIKVTNRSTDTLTVVRAQDGTSAQAYSSSDRIELRPTAVMFEEIRDSERTPADDSVATAKIQDDAVTTVKIADAAVTHAKLASALTASASDLRSGTAETFISPSAVEAACEPVALSDAATVAVDWSSGINFTLTLGGNRTLGFPTNVEPGTWRRIEVTQDGTGSRTLAFTETGYHTANGSAPTLSTAASAVDVLFLYGRSTSIVEVYSGGTAFAQVS